MSSIPMYTVLWIQAEFFEAPLSFLQDMTKLKKAGPSSGPAFGAHSGSKGLAVVSGDLDLAGAVADADRDNARLKSGRHNGHDFESVFLTAEDCFLPC